MKGLRSLSGGSSRFLLEPLNGLNNTFSFNSLLLLLLFKKNYYRSPFRILTKASLIRDSAWTERFEEHGFRARN